MKTTKNTNSYHRQKKVTPCSSQVRIYGQSDCVNEKKPQRSNPFQRNVTKQKQFVVPWEID